MAIILPRLLGCCCKVGAAGSSDCRDFFRWNCLRLAAAPSVVGSSSSPNGFAVGFSSAAVDGCPCPAGTPLLLCCWVSSSEYEMKRKKMDGNEWVWGRKTEV